VQVALVLERQGDRRADLSRRDHPVSERPGRDLLGEHGVGAEAPRLSGRGLDVEAEVHDVEIAIGGE
jgi:hypothetical protein